MNKSVYLYELDSVRNSKEEIQYAQEQMFWEIILNGNQVILTMNQLADSRAFLAAIENENTFEPFFELCQMGVIRISQYGTLRTPSQYFQGKIEEFLKKAEKTESEKSAFIYSGVPVAHDDAVMLRQLLKALRYSDPECLRELSGYNNEENYIQIIKGFLALNDKKNALLYYNKCINIFREELNTSPTEFLLEWKEIIKESSIPKNIKNCKINIFLKEDDEKTILNIECFPSRIEYSFLYELSDILIKNMEIKDKSLLKEISYINSEAGIQDDFYYPDSEIYKIRLFNSFIKLLNIFSEKNGFFLVIKNFHFIDKISFDFFKYLVFSNKIEGNIYLISTLNCEELSYIEKYTIIHKN